MKKIFVRAIILALLLSSCGPTTTDVPTTPLATATADPPLAERVSLSGSPVFESAPGPGYIIDAQIAVLSGSDDPRVQAFNTASALMVQNAIAEFERNVSAAPLINEGADSTFNATYEQFASVPGIVSIKYDMNIYIESAAHPYSTARTLNFDLERGQTVTLESLFLPNSDYLLVIANFCASELQKRDIGFDQALTQGAAPLAENYSAWNIAETGLKITFQQYQVAAGAAGEQTVLVPYSELAALIDPQGLLRDLGKSQ